MPKCDSKIANVGAAACESAIFPADGDAAFQSDPANRGIESTGDANFISCDRSREGRVNALLCRTPGRAVSVGGGTGINVDHPVRGKNE